MNKILFKRRCPRCENLNQYVHYSYFSILQDENPIGCKICKVVDDASLKDFVELKRYTRECPKCHKMVVYKNRTSFRQSRNENKSCKSCSQRVSRFRKECLKQKTWKPIIGHWPVKFTFFIAVREFWNGLSGDERAEFLQKTPTQKRNFWSHLRRKNKSAGHRKYREVMAKKYSGENHWMKRPEVLRKIRKTCEKFRGDNHWFRRGKVSV